MLSRFLLGALALVALALVLSRVSGPSDVDCGPIQGTIRVADDARLVPDRARIPEADARAAALVALPGAAVTDVDLDEEDGFLVYEVETRRRTAPSSTSSSTRAPARSCAPNGTDLPHPSSHDRPPCPASGVPRSGPLGLRSRRPRRLHRRLRHTGGTLATVSTAAAPSVGPYRFDQPVARFEMPDALREISALTVLPDGQLGAVQDEDGDLYVLSAETGRIEAVIPFGPPGDYEGIEFVGDRLFVLRCRRRHSGAGPLDRRRGSARP